ncbi:unnamed protein product [Musa acuminata subsp. burmannicoides]
MISWRCTALQGRLDEHRCLPDLPIVHPRPQEARNCGRRGQRREPEANLSMEGRQEEPSECGGGDEDKATSAGPALVFFGPVGVTESYGELLSLEYSRCYSSEMPQAIDGWSIIAVSLGHAGVLVTTLILVNEFVNLTDKVIYHYICSHFPMILSCSIIFSPFCHSRSVFIKSQ